ncbi:hypothetical protein Aduo_012568 [Ancylostoma duodenale]
MKDESKLFTSQLRDHGVAVEAVENGEEGEVVEDGEEVVRIVANKEAGEALMEEIKEEDRGADRKEVRVAGEATEAKVVGEALTEEIEEEDHGVDRKEVSRVAGEAIEVKEEEVNGAAQMETVGAETEDQEEAEGPAEDVGMVAVETGDPTAGVGIAGVETDGAATVGEAVTGVAGKDQQDIMDGETNHGGLDSVDLDVFIHNCSANHYTKRQFITVIINIVHHTGIKIYKDS